MILFFGTVNHLGTIRPSIFFIYLITTFAVSTVVLSIQQTLSLMSNNQLLPLGIGIGGSFLGLFSLFFPKPVARLVLWGYYANFSVVGMNWDPDTRIIDYYVLSFPGSPAIFPQTRYKIPVQSCVSSVIVRITVSFAK